jgi:hypothetical protein
LIASFANAGARAFSLDNPIQHAWRDVHAALHRCLKSHSLHLMPDMERTRSASFHHGQAAAPVDVDHSNPAHHRAAEIR